MAHLEIHSFTVADGVDETAFRELDARMQEWCHLNRPGLRRRTTALSSRDVVVVTLFDAAPGAIPTTSGSPIVEEWLGLATNDSVSVYELL